MIVLNPDFKDKLTKKAYENLAFLIPNNYPYKGSNEEKESYRKENNPIFEKIVKEYYPDKFEFFLKENSATSTIMGWYRLTENYKKSNYFFEDFLKRKKGLPDPEKDIDVIVNGISSYLSSGNLREGEKWINYSIEAVKRNPELKKNRNFFVFFTRIPSAIMEGAKRMFKKKEIKQGKNLIYSFYDNKDFWEHFPGKYKGFFYNGLAWTIFEAKASDKKTVEIAKKALELYRDVQIMDTLASVYSQLGNYIKAIEIEKEALKTAKTQKDKDELKKKISKWEKHLKNR